MVRVLVQPQNVDFPHSIEHTVYKLQTFTPVQYAEIPDSNQGLEALYSGALTTWPPQHPHSTHRMLWGWNVMESRIEADIKDICP